MDSKFKQCHKCKKELELTSRNFDRNKTKKDGFASLCKPCKKEFQEAWYVKNSIRHRLNVQAAKDAAYIKNDPSFGKHRCNDCGKTEPEVHFHKRRVNGRQYKRHICHICNREYRKRFKKGKANRELINSYNRKYRQDPNRLPMTVLKDCRQSDKKRGYNNDLNKEFITLAFLNGCVYCGEKELRMTLDRIDNTKGHTKDNVNPACIRCNYLRRDMPYDAWIYLVPTLKEMSSKGLFGSWIPMARTSKKVLSVVNFIDCGQVAPMVERYPEEVGVAGSNPVLATKFYENESSTRI